MARFSYQDSENYGSQKSNYFSLKDDGETAKIRFLYNDIDDVEGVATHEVEVEGKRFDVECLRAYNEPVENCPLCAAGYKQSAKLFIPVYDESSKESKIWTRGKTFFRDIAGLCSRYNPLVSTIIEVERHGKKGDTSTTYALFPGRQDDKRIEDFPEIKAEGICFQSKSFEDLNYYLDNGVFPEDKPQAVDRTQRQSVGRRETPATSMPVRRRPTVSNEDTF